MQGSSRGTPRSQPGGARLAPRLHRSWTHTLAARPRGPLYCWRLERRTAFQCRLLEVVHPDDEGPLTLPRGPSLSPVKTSRGTMQDKFQSGAQL